MAEVMIQEARARTAEEKYYMASQTQLIVRKFRKHKLAFVSILLLAFLYFVAITAEFWAPYNPQQEHTEYINAPPSRLRFFDSEGRFRGPFVYGLEQTIDVEMFTRTYIENTDEVYRVRLFQRGDEYRFWGRWSGNLHLFGVEEGGYYFAFGTDPLGRDLLSRIIMGSRVSLSIGLVGVLISFFLGCLFGGLAGYFGGTVDLVISRAMEILGSIPTTPLWLAFSAVIPLSWTVLQTYFAITVILSLLSWTGMARTVRGKLLQLREIDFAKAARLAGAGDMRIVFDHLLPNFMSYLIVQITIQIPQMILAETSLSFLGLGIRPPAISWGTLLSGAQSVQSISVRPWMLIPGIFVVVTVLLFNFVGDGLRDAADPYK